MIFYMRHYSSSCSLQLLAFDTEASHDMLKVWDGPPENEMSLSEISGSLLPGRIHSTLNTVTLVKYGILAMLTLWSMQVWALI